MACNGGPFTGERSSPYSQRKCRPGGRLGRGGAGLGGGGARGAHQTNEVSSLAVGGRVHHREDGGRLEASRRKIPYWEGGHGSSSPGAETPRLSLSLDVSDAPRVTTPPLGPEVSVSGGAWAWAFWEEDSWPPSVSPWCAEPPCVSQADTVGLFLLAPVPWAGEPDVGMGSPALPWGTLHG